MAVQKENKKGRDNIQSKIERLKAFAKQYPYAFSNMAELKKRLEEEGETEEKAELEALYESEYTYLRARNLQGKLSEALIKEIREGRIGGYKVTISNDKATVATEQEEKYEGK